MADVKKMATREGYGRGLVALGAEHEDIVALDADLAGQGGAGDVGADANAVGDTLPVLIHHVDVGGRLGSGTGGHVGSTLLKMQSRTILP